MNPQDKATLTEEIKLSIRKLANIESLYSNILPVSFVKPASDLEGSVLAFVYHFTESTNGVIPITTLSGASEQVETRTIYEYLSEQHYCRKLELIFPQNSTMLNSVVSLLGAFSQLTTFVASEYANFYEELFDYISGLNLTNAVQFSILFGNLSCNVVSTSLIFTYEVDPNFIDRSGGFEKFSSIVRLSLLGMFDVLKANDEQFGVNVTVKEQTPSTNKNAQTSNSPSVFIDVIVRFFNNGDTGAFLVSASELQAVNLTNILQKMDNELGMLKPKSTTTV